MSTKYPGGIISKTAPTPSGPYADSTAPGIWTLEQQAYWQKLGQWPTQGNVNPSAFIENLFSTYLYTGNGTSQSIVNGIDLAGEGGMVWIKSRTSAASHALWDTARTPYYYLVSNATSAEQSVSSSNALTAYNADGFTVTGGSNAWNGSQNYASWTFRKQPKFFDVVTYTGAGSGTTVSHNLGSTPGCVIVKATSGVDGWFVYHQDLLSAPPTNRYLRLDTTDATAFLSNWISVSDTTITFPTAYGPTASSGTTYVAYLFAHNAGGFGLSGSENVISCGSFTTDSGGNATVSLGYEPAWVMFKCSSNAGQNWEMIDTMRGWSMSTDVSLQANSAAAEASGGFGNPTATGFVMGGQGNTQTYIYIAIRRGPMAVPTLGTSVYQAVTRTGNSPTVNSITSVGFPPDSIWQKRVSGSTASANVFDRLIGRFFLAPATTSAETAANTSATRDLISFDMTGFTVGEQWSSELNANTRPEVYWNFLRAPSFFDEVCYTGNGTAGRTITHNLTVAPELMIVKGRSNAGQWRVYSSAIGATQAARLNSTDSFGSNPYAWNDTAPTASVFTVGDDTGVNENTYTYVAYLFATCPGVSKVGSYTGTATTLQVDCGFTSGARFVLIKRTDSTGDWYVWDSARGIVAGNDPYLLINSTAVEVTGTDYVDTYSAGFEISSTAPSAINASGGTFIFLAIA